MNPNYLATIEIFQERLKDAMKTEEWLRTTKDVFDILRKKPELAEGLDLTLAQATETLSVVQRQWLDKPKPPE